MVDFVAKLTPMLELEEGQKENWHVWVDGAVGSIRARIKIVLEVPHNIRLKYSACLIFQATNNVAKYKALLMALRIIKEVRTSNVNIFYDSQLVVNQCQGKFQVKELNLGKYEAMI